VIVFFLVGLVVGDWRRGREKTHTRSIERANGILELRKHALHDAHRVQLVAVNRRRQRQLGARLQTLLCTPRDHDGDVHRQPAIELADAQIEVRDCLRRQGRDVQVVDHGDPV
jgi:hypothetical protein